MPSWSVGGLQHVVGSFIYACGFRRPLFSIFATVFAEITAHPVHGIFKPTAVGVSEVTLETVTLPLASTNLRSPVRRVISSSDEPMVGGGASEASVFTQSCNVATQAPAEDHAAQLNERASIPQDDVVECFFVSANSVESRWRVAGIAVQNSVTSGVLKPTYLFVVCGCCPGKLSSPTSSQLQHCSQRRVRVKVF